MSGSRPEVGSSRTQQLARRRRAPRRGRPSAGCPWSRRGPSWSGRARSARAARRRRGLVDAAAQPAEQVDDLAAGEVGPQDDVAGDVGEPAVQRRRRRATGRRRAGVTLPPSARSRPSRMRMVVDLPAPFGPRKPCTSPSCDGRGRARRGRRWIRTTCAGRMAEMTVLMDATVHPFQKILNVLKSSYDGPCDDPSARFGAPLRGRGRGLRRTARVGPDRRRDASAAGPGLRRPDGRRGRPDDVGRAGRGAARSAPPRCRERSATCRRCG